MKKLVSVLRFGSILMSIIPLNVLAATDAEIEKRIEEVGEEYLEFYRKSRAEDYWMNAFGGFSASKSSTVNSVTMDAGSYIAEEGAEYVEEEDIVPFGGEIVGPVEPIDWDTEEYSPIDESGFIRVDTQPFFYFRCRCRYGILFFFTSKIDGSLFI